MSLVLYRAQLNALAQIHRSVEAALPPGAPIAPPPPALAALAQRLRDSLSALHQTVAVRCGEDLAEQVMFPFVLHGDELALRRLALPAELRWPRLQLALYGIDDGGERLFDRAEELLGQDPAVAIEAREAQAQAMYLCLSDGFQGRFADTVQPIEEYKRRLAGVFPAPPVASNRTPAPVVPPAPPRFPIALHASIAAIVILVPLALIALSR